jgi:hypothetical protein
MSSPEAQAVETLRKLIVLQNSTIPDVLEAALKEREERIAELTDQAYGQQRLRQEAERAWKGADIDRLRQRACAERAEKRIAELESDAERELEVARAFEFELAQMRAEVERLREGIASAMTSLATRPAKDGYAYSVLAALANDESGEA